MPVLATLVKSKAALLAVIVVAVQGAVVVSVVVYHAVQESRGGPQAASAVVAPEWIDEVARNAENPRDVRVELSVGNRTGGDGTGSESEGEDAGSRESEPEVETMAELEDGGQAESVEWANAEEVEKKSGVKATTSEILIPLTQLNRSPYETEP